MLSRVADSVYWMNRYIERAENIARFLDVTHQLALDLPPGRHEPWRAVIDATGDSDLYAASSAAGALDADSVTNFLCFDGDYPSSIRSCVHRARDNARQIREIISSEMWEQVNRFHFLLADMSDQESESVARAPHAFLTAVKLASQQFVGIADGTMTHNQAWHFGQLGRSLERAEKTSRILDVMTLLLVAGPASVARPEATEPEAGLRQGVDAAARARAERSHADDELQWAALLKSVSAFEMYRKRHGAIDGGDVIDFLLFDDEFPRSVRFCSELLARSVGSIAERAGAAGSLAELRAQELRQQIDRSRGRARGSDLHECIDDLQSALNRAGAGVQDAFFDLAPPPSSPSSVLLVE